MADSVISTQTNYPERPDTSLQAYNNAMGHGRGISSSAIGRWFNSHIGNDPTYNQWRTEQIDRYNSDLASYNSFITSLAGQKAQALEAGYNPAWLGSDPGGGTSPLQYQNAEDPGDNPVGELVQGLNMFMSLATGIQNIRKMKLQNDLLGQEINNAAIENVIKGNEMKYSGRYYGYRAFKLGFESDLKKLVFGNEINSRLRSHPEYDGSSWFEETAPGLGNTYEVGPDYRGGFSYQQQYNEVEILKATKQWREYQASIAYWTADEKKYYTQEIQPILKDWYTGRKTYQETVNTLYEEQQRNAMNNKTAGTVLHGVLGILALIAKFIPGGNVVSSILTEAIDPSTGEVIGSTLQTRH